MRAAALRAAGVRLGGAVFSIALAACAPPPRGPAPPPFAGGPPGPPAELGVGATLLARPASDPAPSEPTPAASSSAPADSSERATKLLVEAAYKLEAMPVPKDKKTFQAELAERWRWNTGAMGALAAELPAPDEHPMPRVIIAVTSVKGPHKSADVQRLARRNHWIKVIGCYGLGAWKDQTLRGKTVVAFAITQAGKIESARTVSTTLADAAVAACLSRELEHLEMPRAKARSSVTAEIQIGPGDEPMPPPKEELKPGDGELDLGAARAVVEEAGPRFEACYARALLYAPALWGRIAIRFHVTDKGKLDEAFETESRFPDEGVTRCVLHHARSLRFDKPKGGEARFVVPLRLSTARAVTDAAPPSVAGPASAATTP